MNYLQEVVAFNRWKEVNHLPATAIALWHELMSINNKCGWKKEFTVPNGVLQSYAGLSRKNLDTARMKLIENNLIRYKKGNKANQAGKYEMISIVQNGQRNGQQNGQRNEHETDNETGTLIKHKYKQKENSRRSASAENPFEVYQENFGTLKPILQESFMAWCDDVGNEVMVAAMKLAAQKGGQSFGYVETILKEWTSAKLTTIDDIRIYENQKKQRKDNTVPFRKSAASPDTKSIFEKLREEGERESR